jgi:hypothetical protein
MRALLFSVGLVVVTTSPALAVGLFVGLVVAVAGQAALITHIIRRKAVVR